jgi:hypothetical protein
MCTANSGELVRLEHDLASATSIYALLDQNRLSSDSVTRSVFPGFTYVTITTNVKIPTSGITPSLDFQLLSIKTGGAQIGIPDKDIHGELQSIIYTPLVTIEVQLLNITGTSFWVV